MSSTKYGYWLNIPVEVYPVTLYLERSEGSLTKEALLQSITHEETWGLEDFPCHQEDVCWSLKHRIDECEITEVEEVI